MDGQVSYTCCSSLKRESIVRMMTVSQKNASGQEQPVSLVLVSVKGRVAVYDLSLKLAAAFTLRLSSAPVASIKAPLPIPSVAAGTSSSRPSGASANSYNASSSQKAQLNGWITDCIHMEEFSTLVVASSGRCLHFFTTVVTPFAEKFRLHGMKDIPTTLSYLTPSDDRPEPLLGIGDDGGDVFVLRFLKPSVSLFKKREVDTEVEYIYWRELHQQAGMVTLNLMQGTHDGPVLQVDLKTTLSRVASCSRSSTTSLTIRHIRQQSPGNEMAPLPPVNLRLPSGISCFDYDDEKSLVVSGSTDGVIRVWSATNLAKPWMILTGHTATIAGVLLVQESDFLWSLCDHAELRYWDLTLGKCVSTIRLSFPGRRSDRIQFSLRPLLISEDAVYLASRDYVATVQLNKTSNKTQTHVLETLLGKTKDEESDAGLSLENKIPYRYREGLLDFAYRKEDEVFNKFMSDLKSLFVESVNATQKLKEIERLGIDKYKPSQESKHAYDWEEELSKQVPLELKVKPLNRMKLQEMDGMADMRRHVKDGTPFCGLRLHEPKDINLPKGLPVTGRMKKHGIKSFTTLKEVRAANFDIFNEQVFSLSSARTSLASSILSYYRQKKVGEKAILAGDGDLLKVSNQSQQSSRKSSAGSASSLSSRSSAPSPEV